MRNFGKVARNIGLGMISAVACATLAHAEAMQDDAVAAKNKSNLPLPTGQFVTPTAPPNAVQQFLNPGLPNYPNFVANEAVRSQLSPDGSTLLILCAGYNNNLDKTVVNGQPVTNAGAAGVQQVVALNATMAQPDITDLFYRGYDNNYPDVYRFNEWKREFDGYVAKGDLPTMETVRFNHDHMGAFGAAIAGLNTPETQQADNDLAVGKLVEAVAESPFARDTLIFVVEDDAQDGPDHVDSHRSTAYVAGAYVKKGAVVSKRYSTVSLLRTIEDVLGLQHLNLNTAYQRPMSNVFDIDSDGAWNYTPVASTVLKTTALAAADIGVRYAAGPDIKPTHPASYWEQQTKGMDFSVADRAPADLFNRVVWKGIMKGKPYPETRSIVNAGATTTDDDGDGL